MGELPGPSVPFAPNAAWLPGLELPLGGRVLELPLRAPVVVGLAVVVPADGGGDETGWGEVAVSAVAA